MAVRRITVLLSEEEYTQVRSNAGLVPLSRWFKSLALGVKESRAKTNPIPDVQSQPAIRADVGRKPLPASTVAALREQIPELKTANELPAKRARTCAHGTAQGYACWQCGGKAQIEQ